MLIYPLTFGCKLNQSETEGLIGKLLSEPEGGFVLSSEAKGSDIIFINTCTVTTKAEQKARRAIRQFSRENPDALIIISGCYAELNEADLRELGENVFVFGLDGRPEIPRILLSLTGMETGPRRIEACREIIRRDKEESHGAYGRFDLDPKAMQEHTRPFLKIQDGCNSNCAYCRIRIARGKSVSLGPEEAVRRARDLEEKGYHEIVIVGVSIESWRFGDLKFPALLERLLEGTRGIYFRLSSLSPNAVTPDFLKVAQDPRVREHFHLSIQSAATPVLKRMNRPYKTERIYQAAEDLLSTGESVFLSADIITGFPGERAEDFEETYRFFESTQYPGGHVFPYSPRPGTEAFDIKPLVPERISRERALRLRKLIAANEQVYLKGQMGRELEFITEPPLETQEGRLVYGISGNYLRPLISGLPEMVPSLVMARVTGADSRGRLRAEYTGNLTESSS